jgi:hypothetical protein
MPGLFPHYFKQVYRVSPGGGGGAITVVEGHCATTPGPEIRMSDTSSTAKEKEGGKPISEGRVTVTAMECIFPRTVI